MRCPACGVEVVEQAVYCHRCGERIGPAEATSVRDANAPTASADPAQALNDAAAGRRNQPDQPETELWRGGFSSKAMLGAWVASGFVSLALLVGGFLWAQNAQWWLILLLLMSLPWLYNIAVLCYRRMSVRYALTTQRFVHESGILRRVNDRIEVIDMDDISFEQGLVERLVGVGTVHIVSSDRSHPDLSLHGIENVKEVAGMFDDARRTERRRRGLYVEHV
jgi:hypothetical protein